MDITNNLILYTGRPGMEAFECCRVPPVRDQLPSQDNLLCETYIFNESLNQNIIVQ